MADPGDRIGEGEERGFTASFLRLSLKDRSVAGRHGVSACFGLRGIHNAFHIITVAEEQCQNKRQPRTED